MLQLQRLLQMFCDQMCVHLQCSSAAPPPGTKPEAAAEEFGLVRVRPLDSLALKTSAQAAAGGGGSKLPGPAGFGLDLLPGALLLCHLCGLC